MKTSTLIPILLFLSIVSARSYQDFLKYHNGFPIRQSRDELGICGVQNCFYIAFQCMNDPSCLEESQILERAYLQHPEQYKEIQKTIKHETIKLHIKCLENNCNSENYMKHCATSDAYIKRCVNDMEPLCTQENKPYLDNFISCKSKHYPACDNLPLEPMYSCFASEMINCASLGNKLAINKLKASLLCN